MHCLRQSDNTMVLGGLEDHRTSRNVDAVQEKHVEEYELPLHGMLLLVTEKFEVDLLHLFLLCSAIEWLLPSSRNRSSRHSPHKERFIP